MQLGRVVRTGFGLGMVLGVASWYSVNFLFLKTVLRLQTAEVLERLAWLALFTTLACLLLLGALGALQAGPRSLSDAAWAGAATGAAAALPVYALVATTFAALFLLVLPLLSALANPASQAAVSQMLGVAVASAMWAAPLLAVGTVALLAASGAASGAAYYALTHRG